uniref:PetN n=1 Tax=Angelica tsinlingensis TaxID=357858 RepID=A0A2L1K1E6_9APIA|nr:PetN [Angelica tsinlingensis]
MSILSPISMKELFHYCSLILLVLSSQIFFCIIT